jgi:hypothetical protein
MARNLRTQVQRHTADTGDGKRGGNVQRITELPQFVNRAEPVGALSKSAQHVTMVDMSVSLILNDVGVRSAPLTDEKEQASLIWTQDWGPRPELPTTEVGARSTRT